MSEKRQLKVSDFKSFPAFLSEVEKLKRIGWRVLATTTKHSSDGEYSVITEVVMENENVVEIQDS